MANYLTTKFKGKYRILPEICLDTNDFPRDEYGNIDDDTGLYIKCSYGNKISFYGLNDSRRGVLLAYIPSLGRGRNIKKALKKQKIDFFDYDESAAEVVFKFLASDIEPVAELMKASTSGVNISPFSNRNLPKNDDIKVPENELARYKEITGKVNKKDMLIFKSLNAKFMNDVLAKELRPKGTRKPYDYKSEQKQLKLSRDVKSYIWYKGLFNNYLEFLENEINELYSNK